MTNQAPHTAPSRLPTSWAVLGLALWWVLRASSAAAADDVDAILERMRAALSPPAVMHATFAFDIEDDAGDLTHWTGRFEREGRAHALRMRFESPRGLAGIVFTAARGPSGLDEATIYLPSVRRTRTIRERLRGTPFLGSDFNYEDLGLERLDFQSHRILGAGDVDGRPCDRVESRPTDSWWYGRIVRCVDREDFLPRRTEYFDAAGQPYKIRTLEEVATIDGHPTARRIRMRDLQEGGESTITLTGVRYGR